MTMTDRNEEISPLRTILGSIVLIIGMVAISVVVFIIFSTIQQLRLPSEQFESFLSKPDFNGDFVSIGIISQFIVVIPLLLFVLQFNNKIDLVKFLALSWPKARDIALWCGILVLFIILSTILTTLLARPAIPEFMIAAYHSSSSIWLFTLAIVLFAPVWEELVFRGFLFSGLRNTMLGTTGAVVITSALFALIHTQYDLYIMVEIFLVGIVLCVSRLQTGSLCMPMILHSANNLLAVLVVANTPR